MRNMYSYSSVLVDTSAMNVRVISLTYSQRDREVDV